MLARLPATERSTRTHDTEVHRYKTEAMRFARTATVTGLLLVEAGLATMGVLVHYGVTAEYGDIAASAFEGWMWGFTAGTGGIALVLVGIAAVAALVVSSRRWMRLTAVGIPVLMVVGTLVVTPAALHKKLEVQYDATPQCVAEEDSGPGPGSRARRKLQQALESLDHIGYFGGGGGSGVGGCDRRFILTEQVDPLRHYRVALPAAGWRVVEDRADHLRAEREGMAFEVAVCDRGGVVWAGKLRDGGRTRCDRNNEAVTGSSR